MPASARARSPRRIASIPRFRGSTACVRAASACRTSPAAQLGRSPVGLDPTVALHAIECGIQGPILDLDDTVSGVLDGAGDGIAVASAPGERPEDEGDESSVQELGGPFGHEM